MHNVEFLPDWYPVLQRRRMAVYAQACISAAIVFGLLLTVLIRRWDIRSEQAVLGQYKEQIRESNNQLGKLDNVLIELRKLQAKERDIARLGVDIDTTRVISALEEAMPAKMALTGLSLDTQEAPALPLSQVGIAANNRWLNIRLQGVSPTDVEVAILLDRLSKLKVFNDVAMSYIRDRTEAGHTMRDFELKFRINLNAPAGVKS